MTPGSEREQVRIATFDGEPLARLWEQRLQEEGIPCIVKSLGAGYGAWGGNAFLPHALYVLSLDRERASAMLREADLPVDLLDSDTAYDDGQGRRSGGLLFFAALAILVAALLAAISTAVR
jgi:hypothetical protein